MKKRFVPLPVIFAALIPNAAFACVGASPQDTAIGVFYVLAPCAVLISLLYLLYYRVRYKKYCFARIGKMLAILMLFISALTIAVYINEKYFPAPVDPDSLMLC